MSGKFSFRGKGKAAKARGGKPKPSAGARASISSSSLTPSMGGAKGSLLDAAAAQSSPLEMPAASGSGGFSFGNMQSAPPKLMAQPQQPQPGLMGAAAQPGGGFSFGSSATPQAPSMTGPAPNSGGAAEQPPSDDGRPTQRRVSFGQTDEQTMDESAAAQHEHQHEHEREHEHEHEHEHEQHAQLHEQQQHEHEQHAQLHEQQHEHDEGEADGPAIPDVGEIQAGFEQMQDDRDESHGHVRAAPPAPVARAASP